VENLQVKEMTQNHKLANTQLWSQYGNQIKEAKEFNVRQWECSVSCSHHDRDKNASINILIERMFLLSGKKRTAGTAGIAWVSLDR